MVLDARNAINFNFPQTTVCNREARQNCQNNGRLHLLKTLLDQRYCFNGELWCLQKLQVMAAILHLAYASWCKNHGVSGPLKLDRFICSIKERRCFDDDKECATDIRICAVRRILTWFDGDILHRDSRASFNTGMSEQFHLMNLAKVLEYVMRKYQRNLRKTQELVRVKTLATLILASELTVSALQYTHIVYLASRTSERKVNQSRVCHQPHMLEHV